MVKIRTAQCIIVLFLEIARQAFNVKIKEIFYVPERNVYFLETIGYGHGMYVGENSWIDVVLPLTKETLSCGNRMEQNCAGFGNVYCVSQFVDVDNSGSKMESTCERKSVVWN